MPISQDDLGPAIVKSMWILMGISSLVLLARFWVRIRLIQKVSQDDWVILLTSKYLKSRKFNKGLKNIANWAYWKNTGGFAEETTRAGSPYFEALTGESSIFV